MKTQFGIGDIVSHKNKRHYVGKVVGCKHSRRPPLNAGSWYCDVEWFNGTSGHVREDLLLDVVSYMVNSERLERIEESARAVIADYDSGFYSAHGAIIALKHALEGKVR